MFKIGNLFRNIRESIFSKIILVFVLAAAANATVLRVFQRDFLSNDRLRLQRYRNMEEYGLSLSERLGFPPRSEEELIALGKRLRLRIRYEPPAGATTGGMATSPDAPTSSETLADMPSKSLHDDGSTSGLRAHVGRLSDSLAIIIQPLRPDRGSYTILLESENNLDAHPELLAGLLVILLAILAICYIAVRYILSPLHEIERGVRGITLGDLETRVEVNKADELGRLGRSFNEMVERVKAMISSKEQLLLDVSHEFRSPLTRIKVALEIPGPDARASIDRSLRDLETMLSELLESARLGDARGRLRLERVDLRDLLVTLVSMYEGVAPGLQLLAPSSGPVWATVDQTRIEIVFRNLVENAIKYSSSQSRPVDVRLFAPVDGTVRVEVIDHGIGIPKEDQPHIFEPFYRVDRSRVKSTGGFGLGLGIVQKIIVAHRGQISVESEIGQGSRMIVELPVEPPLEAGSEAQA